MRVTLDKTVPILNLEPFPQQAAVVVELLHLLMLVLAAQVVVLVVTQLVVLVTLADTLQLKVTKAETDTTEALQRAAAAVQAVLVEMVYQDNRVLAV